MLKRIISIFISLFLIFNVSSCKDKEKFMLTGNIENQNVIEIDGTTLKEMIEQEESFVLIIKLEGCSSCESFENDVLKPFIKKTYADVYSIKSYEIDLISGLKNAPKYKLAPNIQIYSNGKSIYSSDYNDKYKYFKDALEFEKLIKEYTNLPKVIKVTESYLDNKIESKETFILYIGWYKCGDCISLMDNVLKEFLNGKNSNQMVYYLEVDEYRKNKPTTIPTIDPLDKNTSQEDLLDYENYMKWLNFAQKYNFADYEDGKVPTIQYYSNSNVVEMIVYKNDIVIDGQVIKSYYEELIGNNYTNEELEAYHKEKVINFFEKYYK